jgi:hypothetical protein
MSPRAKRVLVIAVKNAVNASLVALGPVAAWHYNILSWPGLKHVLVIMGSAVASREALVWVPKILKWSQTNGSDAAGPANTG